MISKGNISLVEISLEGLNDFHEYSVKPQLYEYLEFDAFESIEESKSYLLKLIARSEGSSGNYFFIKLNDIDKIVGSIGYSDFNSFRKSAEIGYGLSPDFWGKKIFCRQINVNFEHFGGRGGT